MAQVIAITDREIDTLHGVGSLAFHLYVLLRMAMDYGTGKVGLSRPLSLAMLAAYTETHTQRGRGVQIAQASEKSIRTALDRLQRIGLLRRLDGDRIAFSLPLAVNASARPKQTRQGGGTDLCTEPDMAEPLPVLTLQGEPGTRCTAPSESNPAHIMYQENQNLRPRPVDNFSGSDAPRKGGSAESDEHDHRRLLALGAQRGQEARPGESWREYRSRLMGR